MKVNAVIALIAAAFLSACATTRTVPDLPEQAAYYTENAREELAKGGTTNAVVQMEIALQRPTGEAKIKALFASDPRARKVYEADIESSVANAFSIYFASEARTKLELAKAASTLPPERIRQLDEILVRSVLEGNLSGKMEIDFSDRLTKFPELATSEHQKAIANRTIAILQIPRGASRQIRELMDYIDRSGPTSGERERIEALLPTFNIRGNELHIVAEKFPKYAEARKAETTALVYLQFKNGDRLLADDLAQVLRTNVRGVDWLKAAGPRVTVVTIERVRNDEKVLAESKRTVTYAQHEVNLFSAALLMPRNASYIYEIVSSGAEIEYGYVVSAAVDGKVVHDELIRGKVGGESRRCENARIQNVFGGVTSAGFVANPDMERACSGPRSVSIDDLRTEVLKKVVDGILNVPAVRAAHALN